MNLEITFQIKIQKGRLEMSKSIPWIIKEEIENLFYTVMLPKWFYIDGRKNRRKVYVEQVWKSVLALKGVKTEEEFQRIYDKTHDNFYIETDSRESYQEFYLFGQKIKNLPKCKDKYFSEPSGQNGILIQLADQEPAHVNLIRKLSGMPVKESPKKSIKSYVLADDRAEIVVASFTSEEKARVWVDKHSDVFKKHFCYISVVNCDP